MSEPNEKQGAGRETDSGGGITEFIQRHRKPIYVSSAALLALLFVSIAVFSLMEVFRNRAIAAVEELSGRYETMRPSITEDYLQDDVAALLEELNGFAKKNSGFAGGRAWLIVGGIYAGKKEWAEAETAYAAAAGKAAKTYLAPLAWFNAAAAAEEQGKPDAAIGYYANSLKSKTVFPQAPRAQFSIGRLHEVLNENDQAVDAYRAVISGWSYDQTWTNLAHSRIIALETKVSGGPLPEEAGDGASGAE